MARPLSNAGLGGGLRLLWSISAVLQPVAKKEASRQNGNANCLEQKKVRPRGGFNAKQRWSPRQFEEGRTQRESKIDADHRNNRPNCVVRDPLCYLHAAA